MILSLIEAGERIAGMLPHTFAALVTPVIVIVIVLLIWAVKWRSPE